MRNAYDLCIFRTISYLYPNLYNEIEKKKIIRLTLPRHLSAKYRHYSVTTLFNLCNPKILIIKFKSFSKTKQKWPTER